MDIFNVVVSKGAVKKLKFLPRNIVLKLQAWIEDIGECGLREMQKIP